jgi:hypothetical protein
MRRKNKIDIEQTIAFLQEGEVLLLLNLLNRRSSLIE